MENNQLQAVTELWKLLFSFQKSMSLRCALELGIADAISKHGQPMTLSQLHSALSLPSSKKPHLHRLMRLMTRFGIFCQAVDTPGSETSYELTPISRLVTTSKVESMNWLSFAGFHLSDAMLGSYLRMGDWFKQEEKVMPFELAHGKTLWQFASRNPEISKLFDDAMVRSSCLYTDAIVKNGAEIFKGIRSLVDVAGGTGGISKVIADNFPHIKCTVLDLPHVVGNFASNGGTVQFVSGDMFEYIPPADAVLLKWILHCWSDDDCVKILRRCKDAIPSREAGGKVFLLEAVVGLTSSSTISDEPQLLFDLAVMTATEGAERDEQEWNKIFTEAGFSSYKIIQTIGFMSIIEIYP